ncbi:tetratricopeptide repeat protein [Tunicatimonas pelagia]|uniref:tetratricopeptide repeat protein n=1 Tax=Tunicatimonas pelagia TaxID=931531 RepID=UPI0026659686|nr:tetratricopeptide repeat protein [Tunicatimonas pelagia]WKN42289.1 tetratricopeptide repeat protein [Tunicatimonas pelagia]
MILKEIVTLSLLLWTLWAYSQPNCNLYKEDSSCYSACLEVEKAVMHYSGDESFQNHLLNAIALCPEFHHAYFELSVNYAKRGLMHEWVKLIDKAVEISPVDHLGWRGWYHWFFMNNYEKAIADIDSLDALTDNDLGTTGDGLYHLNILKGLCYKGLGKVERAIQIIEASVKDEEYNQGAYDYLHLGVLYLELRQPAKALAAFEKQNLYNKISEGYFYSARANRQLGNTKEALDLLNLALETYDSDFAMYDPYRQLMDEIYRVDIESEIVSITNN